MQKIIFKTMTLVILSGICADLSYADTVQGMYLDCANKFCLNKNGSDQQQCLSDCLAKAKNAYKGPKGKCSCGYANAWHIAKYSSTNVDCLIAKDCESACQSDAAASNRGSLLTSYSCRMS